MDHTDLTQADFYNGYTKLHAITTFPIASRTNPAQADEGQMEDAPATQPIPQADAQQDAIRQRDDALPSKALLLATFTRPAKAYFDRVDAIEIDISLKKLHTTNTLEDSTDSTKARLDTETSVDKDLLDDIIRQEVAAKTKKFNSELGQLKRLVTQLTGQHKTPTNRPSIVAKNTRRGPTPTRGASTKNQNTTPTSPPSSRRKKNAQPAAARARGTSEKSQRKKPASETKKKQQRKRN